MGKITVFSYVFMSVLVLLGAVPNDFGIFQPRGLDLKPAIGVPNVNDSDTDTEDQILNPSIVPLRITDENSHNRIIYGKSLTTGNNAVYAFLGIKYATSERFAAPAQVEFFPYVEDLIDDLEVATFYESGPVCPQLGRFNDDIVYGKEDCLYLNIYSNVEIKSLNEESSTPVVIYFHGGQFVKGGNSLIMPTKLVEKGVILVTVQYRLGALGFFKLNDDYEDYDGNQALQDQAMAIEWVNDNIEKFGGNPDKITLMGSDSGAVSAIYHFLNTKEPSIRGEKSAYSGIIAHSGSILQPYAYDPEPYETSLAITEETECSSKLKDRILFDESDDWKTCMKNIDFKDIVLAVSDLRGEAGIPFMAPGKGILVKDGILVNDDPLTMLKTIDDYDTSIPLILGTVGQEGSTMFGALSLSYLYPAMKNESKDYLEDDLIPEMLKISDITDTTEIVAYFTKQTYLDGVDYSKFSELIPGMTDMSGALLVKSAVYEQALLLTKKEAKVYLYSFEHNGQRTMFPGQLMRYDTQQYYRDAKDYIGVAQGDDLMYLITLPKMTNSKDSKVEDNMLEWWSDFIKKGSIPKDWTQFTEDDHDYFRIEENSEMEVNFESRYTIYVDGGVPDSPDETTVTASSTTEATGTTSTVEVTTEGGNCPTEPCDCEDECVSYCQDIDDEREAYMITMIIFIILFVIALGVAIYLGIKK